MSVRLKEYHRPTSQAEVLTLLRRAEVRSHVLITRPRPEALLDLDADAVIDLSQLNLAYLNVTETGARLGALAPLQAVVESPPLLAVANGILPEAARLMAGWGLRQLATVGGALASSADLPEFSLALLALGARAVVCQEAGAAREMALADFLAAPRPADELLLEVQLAWESGGRVGGALERVARTPRDTAILAAAASVEVDAGRCRGVRLALSHAGVPVARLASLAQGLVGRALAPAEVRAVAEAVQAEAQPSSDFRASAEYRRQLVEVLTRRALTAAWQRATA